MEAQLPQRETEQERGESRAQGRVSQRACYLSQSFGISSQYQDKNCIADRGAETVEHPAYWVFAAAGVPDHAGKKHHTTQYHRQSNKKLLPGALPQDDPRNRRDE